MTTTIIDGVTVAATGGQASGEFEFAEPTFGRTAILYVNGDASSTDVTLEFFISPHDATGEEFYELTTEQLSNQNLTSAADNRRAFVVSGVRGAGRLRVRITNHAAVTTTVSTVKVDEYDQTDITQY